MANIETMIQQAEQHCVSQGVRLTEKRKQILIGLIQSNKALSAYELIDFCKEHYGINMPAMSVYRILEFLEDQGLVHKLNLANKYVACVHISCDHNHAATQFLICSNCSKVKEVSIEPAIIAELQAVSQQAEFKLISPQLEMNCLCEACLTQVA